MRITWLSLLFIKQREPRRKKRDYVVITDLEEKACFTLNFVSDPES